MEYETSGAGGRDGDRDGGHERKVRATFHLPAELLEEVRNTVVALSGPPERMTMAGFAEQAFRRELQRLRSVRPGRQSGRAFPQRSSPVRTGRPIN